jgi:ABC-type transport system involved in multi-copper enzyme maturation permease subunit
MSQLLTLIWLKWRLLRNSLRSSKAIVNKVASILGMLLAFMFAAMFALILGFVAYSLAQPEGLGSALQRTAARDLPAGASTEFIFFSIFGIIYLMWATVPLSLGGSKQFDAGKLLMYPITLRKLFAVDFISEFTTLHSVFLVPAVLAMCIGSGLGSGNLSTALIAAVPGVLFGVALSKWLSTTIGSILRRKRSRGETIIALIGAIAGLGTAAISQVAPILFKHAESFRSLRWTPPGAAAFLLMADVANDPLAYAIAFVTLSAYAIALLVATYWIARRAALGLERRQKQKTAAPITGNEGYAGWQVPFLPADLSAIVEKELRYALRNAQVRMMALMPLIIILIRMVNRQRFGTVRHGVSSGFLTYGSGLLLIGGLVYVFLILAGMSSNLFAFEEGGMRTLILSPIDRRKILLGKNLVLTLMALVFASALLILNVVIFQDTTPGNLLFLSLTFIIFASISSMIGNWLSIRFPKRMKYGKRLNVSGVAGLFLIPQVVLLISFPSLATLIGYSTSSLSNEYMALAAFAMFAVNFYVIMLNRLGKLLARREIEILDAVREPADE